MVALGVIGTLVAVGLAIAALSITASRNSVDDALVEQRVNEYLADLPVGAGVDGDVIPELTPKSQLPLAPDSEVNVAVAPNMPTHSGRTTQAIVDVHFEVVEGVNTIDLNTGTETET